jgi:hypothetical protein
MDPITLLLLLLMAGGTAAVVVVAVLNWTTVEAWLKSNQVGAGYAEVFRERLTSGRYRVVAGVFDSTGTSLREMTWEATSLDSELSRRLGTKQVIRVTA